MTLLLDVAELSKRFPVAASGGVLTNLRRHFTRTASGRPRFADHPQGLHAGTAYAFRPAPDVQIVTIDPFRSKTAAKSDWWLPIRPGTDAALALGMMHILWRDGSQDDDYLDRYCLGGEQLHVPAAGAEGDHAEAIGVAADDVDGLGADGARGAEQNEVAHVAIFPDAPSVQGGGGAVSAG